ncbi:MAG TPA: murein transglycosylase [Propionibacteriaceae bacterium]|nr:murein transglycosylase [Propionibacteriaceae bacterium]
MDDSAERRAGWWRPVVTVAGAAVIVVALLAGVNLSRTAAIVASGPASEAGVVVEPSMAASSSAEADAEPSRADVAQVSPAWAQRVAGLTGIPQRAVLAYAAADLALRTQKPSCRIGWNTLAAIGAVESGHGSHDGAVLDAAGRAEPAIRGPRLDGSHTARVTDSDQGSLDGDTRWDRAVGPMQFLPSTWRTWGRDGSGDGVADPDQIDDATLTAADYLCAAGGALNTSSGWTRAIWAYNHSSDYVDRVRRLANDYAAVAS